MPKIFEYFGLVFFFYSTENSSQSLGEMQKVIYLCLNVMRK